MKFEINDEEKALMEAALRCAMISWREDIDVFRASGESGLARETEKNIDRVEKLLDRLEDE
jgi:hypothetical protein